MKLGISKVVVVGRDADAWIAALLFKQVLSSLNHPIDVHLIELSSDLVAHDFYSVLPGHQLLHKVLGANESSLLNKARGIYSFGHRYSNWSGNKQSFMRAYDRFGADFKGVDFWHYWLKASAQGLAVPLEDFSLGSVAAKAGRYATTSGLDDDFSEVSYGYNFAAIPYIQSIARMAIKVGVKHSTGPVSAVEVEEGNIKSVLLADGQKVDADFFIDASGTEASLIRHLEHDNHDSWSEYFLCDQLMLTSTKALTPRPAFTQVSAFAYGSAGFYPLLDKTSVAIGYSSKFTTPKEVIERVSAMSGLRLETTVLSNIAYGARKQHWLGNCLAVGNTAVSADISDATHLHFLHVGLSLLRSLFPNSKNCVEEAKIYNDKIAKHISGVRDFQLAHYCLNKRYGEPYWDEQRRVSLPDSLRYRLDLFQERGMVSLYEEDVFQGADWAGLFIGHGVIPNKYSPLVDQIPDAELMVKFQQILTHINKEVTDMMTLDSQIEINVLN